MRFNKNGSLNKRWVAFDSALAKHSELPTSQWDYYQCLGYLVSQLETRLNLPTQVWFLSSMAPVKEAHGYKPIKDANSPSRHPTLVGMRELLRHTFAGDATKTKAYLDWAIDDLVKRRSTVNESLGYFSSTDLIERFMRSPAKTITRSDTLPVELDCLTQLELRTYGDIAFAIQVPDMLAAILQLVPSFDATPFKKVV